MGADVMAAQQSVSISTDIGGSDGYYRTTAGWGQYGARVYSRPVKYTPLVRSAVGGGGFASITLTASSGAILGRIRTDIQKTILKELEFTIDEKGCADFTMTLNQLPDFPLLPISLVTVNIGNTDFNWFTGFIERAPEEGTFQNRYVYRGYGLRNQLSRVTAETSYAAPLDIGLIVDDLVQNYVITQTNIAYNASKIQTTTGVLIASDIQFSKAGMEKNFDTLAEMAGARWGVDGDGEFYFELRESELVKNWFVGYDLLEFNPDLNVQNVKNSIFVKRQSASGESKAGWAVAAIVNDETSQAKFGVRELQYQMPGYFSDSDCELVANALLNEMATPKYYGKVKEIPVNDSGDYIERGNHRFINTPTRYNSSLNECEDVDDWTVTGGSGGTDLAIVNVQDVLVSGAFSMKMTWTAAQGTYVYAPIAIKGGLKKIKMWLRSNRTGQLLTVGVGLGSFLQSYRTVSFNATEQWFLFEWDVSDLSLSELDEIGFVINDSDTATNVWIDNIECELIGSKHYTLEFNRATYIFSPDKQVVQAAEFGPPPERMYDYVSNLIKQAEENRLTGEQR